MAWHHDPQLVGDLGYEAGDLRHETVDAGLGHGLEQGDGERCDGP